LKFEYDRGGRLTRKTYPNGLQTHYRYDTRGYVASIETRDRLGAPISTIRYTSDLTGQKVVRDEVGRSRASYKYDSAGQLAEVSTADGALAYLYDARGNRLQARGTASTVSYTYDTANQLVRAGDERFEYDPTGNLVRRQVGADITQYEYGSSNRLTAVRLPGGKTVRYFYGPWGEKVKSQNIAGEVSHFIYDGLNLHAALDGNLRLHARYHSYGLDNLASVEVGGEHHFYHKDHLGSVQMLTDKDGRIVRRYDYEPFGMVKSLSGDDANALLFTGRPFDQEVGLYDFRFRTFDPRLGRFLQRDPIPDMNAYIYARNDPLNRLDPLGLFDIGDWKNWASLGLSGAGGGILLSEGAGATLATVAGTTITVGTGGAFLLVAGGLLGAYQLYTFWNDPKEIGTKAGQKIVEHGGFTPQERQDLGLEPLAGSSPSPPPCPAPSPTPSQNP
jgi:RHS repeat-associated protein